MTTHLSPEQPEEFIAALSGQPQRVEGAPGVRVLRVGKRIIVRLADSGEVEQDETPHLDNLRSIATQMPHVEVN